MALIKTSLICTVLNEEESVQELIDSIINQSVMPDEIIIVDGGSTDSTTEVIMAKIKKIFLKIFKNCKQLINKQASLIVNF